MSSFLSHLYGSEGGPDISKSHSEPETAVAVDIQQPHKTEDLAKPGEGLLGKPFAGSREHPDAIGVPHRGFESLFLLLN